MQEDRNDPWAAFREAHCPACGAIAWRDMAGSRAQLACEACGYTPFKGGVEMYGPESSKREDPGWIDRIGGRISWRWIYGGWLPLVWLLGGAAAGVTLGGILGLAWWPALLVALAVAVVPTLVILVAVVRGWDDDAARTRFHAERDAFLKRPTFPVYGLAPDTFEGEWWVRGFAAGRAREERHVTLAHHTRSGWGVDVRSTHARNAADRKMLELELAALSDERGGADAALARHYRFEHGVPELARAQPERRHFVVDDARVTFDVLSCSRAWVAWTTLGGTSITVSARGIAPEAVRLARLHSLTGYVRLGMPADP
jgi:hypothetical protein